MGKVYRVNPDPWRRVVVHRVLYYVLPMDR